MANIGDVLMRFLAQFDEGQVVKAASAAGDKASEVFGKRLKAGIGSAVSDFGTQTMKLGKGTTQVGDAMTRNITLPILAAGAATGKLALDFNTSMNQIVGLAKVPRDQIAGISDQILKMAGDIGRDPQELAQAFYFVASAGFKADEAMRVLETSAKASAAGMGRTQDVAKVLGGVLNAYGHDNITAAHAADVLTAAVQDGSAEASDFAGAIGMVVPNAAALGVSFDQVAAAMAAMTNVGVDTQTAAVNLGQVFSALQKPSAQAEAAMQGLGTSSAELRAELKDKGLLALLRDLEARFGGNEVAAAAVFGNIRALRGVTQLLGLDTKQLNTIFGDTAGALGNLQQAYNDTDGPQRQIDKSMAELKATAILIGNDVLPIVVEVLHELAGGAKEFAKWWKGLSDTNKKAIIQWAAFLAIAGPVLSIIGRITTGIGGLTKGLGFLITKIPLLGAAIKGALGPIGWIIAGTEALKFGLNQVTDGAVDSEEAFRSAAGATGDFDKAMQRAGKAWQRTGLDARTFRDAVIDAMQTMGLSFDDAVTYVEKNAYRLTEAWKRSAKITTGIINHATSERLDAAAAEGAAIPAAIAGGVAAGTPAVGAAAQGMTDEMRKAAADAHKAVVDEVSQMFKDLTSVLTNREAFDKEWKAFIDEIEHPFPDRARRVLIEGQLASKALRTGLLSSDSQVRQDSVDKVNNLIAQYELLAPGALGSGQLVNPKLKAGIDSNVQLAINAAQAAADKTGAALDMTTAAGEAGLGGIQAYVNGVNQAKASAEQAAYFTAQAAARAMAAQRSGFQRSGFTAAGGFNEGVTDAGPGAVSAGFKLLSGARAGASGSLWGAGHNVGQSWIEGLIAAIGAVAARQRIAVEARLATLDLQGNSPPQTGPLRNIDKEGFNVGSAWTSSFVAAIRALDPRSALSGISAGLSGVRAPSFGAVTPSVPALGGAALAAAAGGVVNNFNLVVEGKPKLVGTRDEVIAAWQQMGAFASG